MDISQKNIEKLIGKQLTQAEYVIYINLLKSYSIDNEYFDKYFPLQQKIFVSTIEAGNEELGAKKFFQDSILESYSNNNLLCASNVIFSFPNPDKAETRKLLSGAISGISQAASEMAVPVLSSNVKFSNSVTEPLLIIGTVSAKVEKTPDNDLTLKHLLIIDAQKDNNIVHPFSYKLMKECMLEIMQINGASIFYSSYTHAALISAFIKYSGFDSCIHFIDNNSKYQYINNLSDSSRNCFLVALPIGEAKSISATANKYSLSAKIVANVTKVKGCIIISNGIEQFEISKKNINIFTANYLLNQKTDAPIKKAKTILPKEIEVNKELAMAMLSHPNLASKRWIKEQFERFIGNNNLSVNYHTDCPVLIDSDNKILTFTTSTTPTNFRNFESDLTFSILDNYRRSLASGSTPVKCLIEISVDAAFDGSDISKKVQQISSELGFIAQLTYNNSEKSSPNFVVSMLGKIEKKEYLTEYNFKSKGDIIYLLGETKPSICIELLGTKQNYVYENEKKEIAQHVLFKKVVDYSIEKKLIKSAHNISSHGLFHSLVEASVHGKFGFDITTDSEIRTDIYLFSGHGGRILMSASPEKEDKLIDCLVDFKVPFTMLGHVTKEELRIDDISYGFIADVRKTYLKSFGKLFEE